MNGRLKTIYFTVDGVDEQVEFFEDDSVESLLYAFSCAAESDRNAILKLLNTDDSIVSITPQIVENTPETRYSLTVIGPRISFNLAKSASFMVDIEKAMPKSEKGDGVVTRLLNIEAKIKNTTATTDFQFLKLFNEISVRMNSVQRKIREAEYLVWMGFKKNPVLELEKETPLNIGTDFNDSSRLPINSKDDVSKETLNDLKKLSFDNWAWRDDDMLHLMKVMFYDLGIVEHFNIDGDVLHNFCASVRRNYNDNPFHNFRHGFCVTQMMYSMLYKIELIPKVDMLDIMCLLIACAGHDLDHPGFNNAYQINAQTELAIIYNDSSPLENHHCSVLFEILKKPECNMLKTLTDSQRSHARRLIVLLILSTDMAKHGEILTAFKGRPDNLDLNDLDSRLNFYQMLIKCSDISNEARPQKVAEIWCDCLLEEFFTRSDTEKLEGLPVAPFMDRDKVSKASSQVGFISFVIIPLFEQVARVCPSINDILTEIQAALHFYKQML